MKKFLKPDKRKIVLFIILLAMASLYSTPYFKIFNFYGFPLSYFAHISESSIKQNGFCDLESCPNKDEFDMSFQNLSVNMVFWYLLSCLIIWIYDKFKGGKNEK